MRKSTQKLAFLEHEIQKVVRQFSSAELLLAVNGVMKKRSDAKSVAKEIDIPPFIAAAISSFAIRFSNPHRGHKKGALPLLEISDLVFKYLGSDPIAHDEEMAEEFRNSNPIFMLLRIAGSQFPFQVNTFATAGQSLLLYGELPKEIEADQKVPKFNFSEAFKKITGLPLDDFIYSGFVAWAAFSSGNNLGLTREYFEKARLQGMRLPSDEGIICMLNCISADPKRFREKYEEMKQKDRRFSVYDFNPLLTYPILRPWFNNVTKAMLSDRIIAPVPDLVAYRISTGIFYEMFNHYKTEFSDYFGHLFEAYAGRLLKASVGLQNLITKKSIRQTYPTSAGKTPDFVIMDGSTVILVECKSTRFSLPALSTGAEESVNESLKQVLTGLKQLFQFKKALQERRPGLERFYHCTAIKPLLITFEPLYMINSKFFRKHVDNLLRKDGIHDLAWQIMDIKELECFQSHFQAGESISSTLSALESAPYNQVLNELADRTGRTYKDSMLYKHDQEMYKQLGVGD